LFDDAILDGFAEAVDRDASAINRRAVNLVYLARRTTEGRSKREIIRALNRYVARR
jgi:predicted transcriptional regulator